MKVRFSLTNYDSDTLNKSLSFNVNFISSNLNSISPGIVSLNSLRTFG